MLAGEARGDPGVILQTLGPREHVHGARFLDRLAGVERLEVRQLIIALAQQLRGLVQDAPALGTGERAHLRCAAWARATAASTCVAPSTASCASVAPVAGLMTRKLLTAAGRAGCAPGAATRQLLQPSVDERRQQRPGALAVGLLPLRQRGPQPHAIDHGGDHRGEGARLSARDHLAQVTAQI